MNLDRYHIRSLLAPLYKEACFDVNINMVHFSELMEHLAKRFEMDNAHYVWRNLKLDRRKFDTPTYIKYMVRLEKEYFDVLATFTSEKIKETTQSKSREAGYSQWFLEYADALVQWNGIVCAHLCETSFEFDEVQNKEIENFKKLNRDILNTNWMSTKEMFLTLGANDKLPDKTRSNFYIYAGEIELHHILPDYEESKALFTKAKELFPNDDVERVFGEHHLKLGEFEQVKKQGLLAIEMDSSNLDNYLLMGDCYRDEKKYSTAIQWYNDAIQINFYDAGAHRRKIILYGLANYVPEKPQEANAIIETLCQLSFDHPEGNILYDTYRDIGYAYYQSKEVALALEYYHKAIALKPHLPAGYLDLGYVQIEQKEFELAEKNFLVSQKLAPNYFEVYWALSFLYEAKKNWNKTVQYYLKCLELRPSQSELIHHYLGFFYKKMDSYKESKKHYELALAQSPENKTYQEDLKALIQAHGTPEEMRNYLEQVLSKAPNDPLSYHELAFFLASQKEYHKAIELYHKAIELFDQNPIYFENLGIAYENIGDLNNAEKMFQKAIDLELVKGTFHNRMGVFLNSIEKNEEAIPFYEEAVQREKDNLLFKGNLGIAYNRSQRWEEAIECFTRVLENDPQDASANSQIGVAYLWISKLDIAKPYLEKAVEIEPNHAQHYENLGYIPHHRLDYTTATDIYEKGIAVNPEYAPLHNQLGSTYYFLNNFKQSIEHYEKAVALAPDSKEYQENLEFAKNKLKKS